MLPRDEPFVDPAPIAALQGPRSRPPFWWRARFTAPRVTPVSQRQIPLQPPERLSVLRALRRGSGVQTPPRRFTTVRAGSRLPSARRRCSTSASVRHQKGLPRCPIPLHAEPPSPAVPAGHDLSRPSPLPPIEPKNQLETSRLARTSQKTRPDPTSRASPRGRVLVVDEAPVAVATGAGRLVPTSPTPPTPPTKQ